MMKITLRAARVNAGLTQVEAAARAGIARCTVNRWETGKYKIPMEAIRKLCTVYGVDVRDIRLE